MDRNDCSCVFDKHFTFKSNLLLQNSFKMDSKVQEEVEKLKLLYKTSSKALENWPESDRVSCCDDNTFAQLLEKLTDVELEAAVHGLQRQLEIEQLIVKNLECIRIINSDCPDTNSKLISSQEKVARLRSRLLRCLSKQLNNNGHKECTLPPWHGRLHVDVGKSRETSTATTATTAERNNQESPKQRTYYITNASHEKSTNMFTGSDKNSQSSKSLDINSSTSTTSENGEQLEQDALSNNELENLHWVEPKDVCTSTVSKSTASKSTASKSTAPKSTASKSTASKTTVSKSNDNDISGESSTSWYADQESVRETDASEGGLKSDLKEEETGLKKIQKTLENKPNGKDQQAEGQDIIASPPPKPLPYHSQSADPMASLAEEGDDDIPDGYLLTEQPQMQDWDPSADPMASLAEEGDDDIPDGYLLTEQPQMQDWDPTLLLYDLFGDQKDKDEPEEEVACSGKPTSVGVVRMSGYMDKLPSSYRQKKSSVFKGWKRRHFKAFDGKLFYFEDHRNHEPLGLVDLKGSSVVISNGRILELIDSEGKAALKVRCATPVEAEDWKEALEEETKSQDAQEEDSIDTSPEGSVVVIDLGSSSIKAGFASGEAWPQLIFPCVCAELKDDESDCTYGFAALAPERRKKSILRFPLRRSLKIDKLKYSPSSLTGILEHIFNSLKVDPSKHKVIMTLPQNTSLTEKGELVEILLGFFGVEACFLQQQSILAMYSYSAVSGIIVDIGDHIDVIPVVEGCIIEAGASRLPFGGRQVTDMLARLLTEKGHRFFSEVESYITRHIKEKACYVNETSITNDEEMPSHPSDVMLDKYNIPDGTQKVTFDTARYRCTEGLFDPRVWGKDHPGIHNLTYKAIMACGMDVRKQMCRNIYLSGGGSMLPGFPERLQTEVSALLPPHNIVQVHAGTDRHYAAFIGASVVANLPLFEELCITQDDWNDMGTDALEKWQNS